MIQENGEDKKSEKDEKDEEKKEEEKKKMQNFDEILTLKDIDLEIKKGEFVCIIGEVGSGKSTLLLSMLGELLYVPQSEVEVAGMDRELTKEERKAITHSLQNLDIDPADAPIQLCGSLAYVEQQAWI